MSETVMMLGFNADMFDVLERQVDKILVYDDAEGVVPEYATLAGTWRDAAEHIAQAEPGQPIPVVIGVASSGESRAKAIDWLQTQTVQSNFRDYSLVSDKAVVSKHASIAAGAFVGDCAYIGPGVILSRWACILPGGRVNHESVIGLGSIVVGNATVLGRCHVGRHCRICAAATVLPGGRVENGMIVPYRGLMRRGVPNVSPPE